MSNKANFKKIRSIVKVDKIIADNEVVEFKIGQTSNLMDRENDYKNEGYTNFHKIAECDSAEELDNLERDLIRHFKGKSKCANQNDGGGGKSSERNEYHIYVVTK